jgi:Putative Ig domain
MRVRPILLVALALAAASALQAALIQTTPILTSGSGIGGVNTVLTVQSTGSESGCVGWNGSADVVGAAACAGGQTGGDEKTGSSLTQTRSLGELGITAASSLRVVLNSAEPGGDPITLNSLTLVVYDGATGAVLFTSSLASAISFPFSNTGTGSSGFVFQMDTADAIAAQPFFGTPTNRVGLSATLSDAAGGNETFYVVDAGVVTLCPTITISPTSLPDPTAGVAYSQQIIASGGASPYVFAVVGGALPNGLTLATGGLLSGSPADDSAGGYAFVVRATDANGCTRDQDYQFTVLAAVPTLSSSMVFALAVALAAVSALTLRRSIRSR